MIAYWINSSAIRDAIYIPKYYDPTITERLQDLAHSHDVYSIGDLAKEGIIELGTGDEIGKSAYGTGDIPFVRTSDISNWEIKSSPKQGVSRAIYETYSDKQNVQEGDILLVRDGTYLIGRNCFITAIDKELLYQSHIVKIRIKAPDQIAPELFFLALNSPIVQKQIRSVQFTADIIDTLGQRLNQIRLPFPSDEDRKLELVRKVRHALDTRVRGKAFIKQAPYLLESVLSTNSAQPIKDFLDLDAEQMAAQVSSRTITAEFGAFESFWHPSTAIKNSIYLPKYYDPTIDAELENLSRYCNITSMAELRAEQQITYFTGDEIGKMAYGTGEIPFIRTSDFSNWEILHNPKQGISEEIYQQYAKSQDLQQNDILLVRDGTYLVGSSCIVTTRDVKSLFCGGLYKIHVCENDELDPFLFLGLLNSFIVKRQIRTKQFTRDVIDTLGNRLDEVYIPIPKDRKIRQAISDVVQAVIYSRIESRDEISRLARSIEDFT